MTINVIIAAGGLSQRYGIENKLLEPCGTSCVLVEAIKPFLTTADVTKVIVAIDTSYSDEFLNAISAAHLDDDTRIVLTLGGKTRTDTVKNAIRALDDNCEYVIIHDGARPYVTNTLIDSVISGAKECGASLPLLALTDALVSVKDGVMPKNRDDYRRVQTPACFEKNRLLLAYSKCKKPFFDDLSVVQTYAKGEVHAIEGDPKNIKITTKEDLHIPLTGCGYDIHRLEQTRNPDGGIKLLGTLIPCEFSFVAHSDGDVPIHALMDAILSAIGEKDIGHHFPVDDSRFDGADSMQLLKYVLELAKKKGYSPSNAAISIIAQEPMLATYIDAMRENLAKALDITGSRIGITATTNEGVGEIGAGNAIAAYATVLMR